jgi:hypothetical protein
MVTAALLHDSGKIVSGLGTFARVGATLARPLIRGVTVDRWLAATGTRRRLAAYWRHPELGYDQLVAAGSHPFVAQWARDHHRPVESWSVPVESGLILRRCDDD